LVFFKPIAVGSRSNESVQIGLHEIKHDGYHMMVRRDATGARLFTRRGFDGKGHYPAIPAAGNAIRARSFVIDGRRVYDEGARPVFQCVQDRSRRRGVKATRLSIRIRQDSVKSSNPDSPAVRRLEEEDWERSR
jgi:ATP-dependent DNA ligase